MNEIIRATTIYQSNDAVMAKSSENMKGFWCGHPSQSIETDLGNSAGGRFNGKGDVGVSGRSKVCGFVVVVDNE